MNDQQPEKRVFIVKPEGRRTRGRPCSRWADNTDMDIRTIGGRDWKATAANRENWGRLLRKDYATDDDDDGGGGGGGCGGGGGTYLASRNKSVVFYFNVYLWRYQVGQVW
jgi:hypothetical protein